MNLQALEGMSNLLHFSTIHIILQSHHSKVQKYQQGKMCLQFFVVQCSGTNILVLEIKPCGLGSRIRDMEAEQRLKVITDLIS